jgi:hypothetical protein
MKVWRLQKHDTELEVLEVDDRSRMVTKTTSLSLRKPMTLAEAAQYMKDHYPSDLLVNIL